MVTALLQASQDPWVGPSVLGWMAAAQPAGADGFDQDFGLFGLADGVKQGWSDPDWEPRNVHSVGWTDRSIHRDPARPRPQPRSTPCARRRPPPRTCLPVPGAPGSDAPATGSIPTTDPTTGPSTGPSTGPDPGPADGTDPTAGSTSDPTGADPLADLGRSVADLVEQRLLSAFRL
jgi:hypothetical protein